MQINIKRVDANFRNIDQCRKSSIDIDRCANGTVECNRLIKTSSLGACLVKIRF